MIYSQMALENPSNADAMIQRVQQWDPQNAVPHVLEASREASRLGKGDYILPSYERLGADERFMAAMHAAVSSPKYDSYLSARLDLDRALLGSGKINNPLFILSGIWSNTIRSVIALQSYTAIEKKQVEELKSKGALADAHRISWALARFGQVMALSPSNTLERSEGMQLQTAGFNLLGEIDGENSGGDTDSMIAYQLKNLGSEYQRDIFNVGPWAYAYQWNAQVVQVSLFVLLLSPMLIAAWGIYFLLRRRVDAESGWIAGVCRASGFAGAMGLLVSSVALYVSYHPYAELVRLFGLGKGSADIRWFTSVFWSFSALASNLHNFLATGLLQWSLVLAVAVCLAIVETLRIVVSTRRHAAA